MINIILKVLRKYVHASITNFTNGYKTANNGRILDFKVSIEVYGHSASNYNFRIFKNQKNIVAILDFFKLSISQPFEELQD